MRLYILPCVILWQLDMLLIFLSLFGLTSKRDLDMIVACIEDDEKADVALSYGIGDPVKSWINVQNSTVEGDDDVMLLE